jgi:hypothetical protein
LEIELPALRGLFPSLLWREPKPLEPRVFEVACFVELFLSCLSVHDENCTAWTTKQEEALAGARSSTIANRREII